MNETAKQILSRLNPECGQRTGYLAGCRCVPCRAANARAAARYQKLQRQGKGNPWVSAEPAKEHLLSLSKAGIGKRTVADAANLSVSCIASILNGNSSYIRKKTADAILAVDDSCLPESALVPAGPTWRKINWMLREGFSKAEIARRLGYRSPSLQFRRDYVTAKTERKVARLYAFLNLEA